MLGGCDRDPCVEFPVDSTHNDTAPQRTQFRSDQKRINPFFTSPPISGLKDCQVNVDADHNDDDDDNDELVVHYVTEEVRTILSFILVLVN
jgi:hypothetical protein